MPHFEGVAEVESQSMQRRLTGQHEAIKEVMLRGRALTLQEITDEVLRLYGINAPPASVSAQLRHLRKPRFGGFDVTKEHVGNGLYRYRVSFPEVTT
jgi:hypothetical protein